VGGAALKNNPERATVLIPAYNEAGRIASTVLAVRSVLPDIPVWVLDDGSTDDTALQAEQVGACVLRLSEHLPATQLHSKGTALWYGWQRVDAQIYLFLDADLGDSACHAPALLTPILSNEADVTVAVLPNAGKGGGFGWVAKTARWWLRKRTGRDFRAPLSGQRAIKREVLELLPGFARGYGLEVGLTADTCRAGFRVVELEVPFSHRQLGKTMHGFLHRGKQMIDVIRAIRGKREMLSTNEQRNE
jgi:glycosyltransferase involved in cell wall biosynthesis